MGLSGLGVWFGTTVPRIMRTEEGDTNKERSDEERPTGFLHSNETWKEMWKAVELESGMKWEIESRLSELVDWGPEPEDSRWMGSKRFGDVVHLSESKWSGAEAMRICICRNRGRSLNSRCCAISESIIFIVPFAQAHSPLLLDFCRPHGAHREGVVCHPSFDLMLPDTRP